MKYLDTENNQYGDYYVIYEANASDDAVDEVKRILTETQVNKLIRPEHREFVEFIVIKGYDVYDPETGEYMRTVTTVGWKVGPVKGGKK